MLMVEQFFGAFGTISYVPGRSICAADIADADMLLVRSVTQVNKALLEGSSSLICWLCDYWNRPYRSGLFSSERYRVRLCPGL